MKLSRYLSSTTSTIKKDVIAVLQQRGLVAQITRPSLGAHLARSKTAVYVGFDPTAKSLHVGNLLSMIALIHFARAGHIPVALIGGATGTIGDPSGRSIERIPLDHSTISTNVSAISKQVERILSNASESAATSASSGPLPVARILNNNSWLSSLSLLDFMSSVGRVSRVSIMLARDSVKSRLESPQGISFVEFSYQLMQAYDFYWLWKNEGVSVQIGGSDQWGNIVSGIDLIRKLEAPSIPVVSNEKGSVSSLDPEIEVFGLTIPLVTTSTGEKFGKSAGNAIWLDKDMCSPFDFYQFFRRTPDSDVARYLAYFTFLEMDEISQVMAKHKISPDLQEPQRLLAYKVTHLVHGSLTAEHSRIKSELLYDSEQMSAVPSVHEIIDAFEDDNRLIRFKKNQIYGFSAVQVAVMTGAAQSTSAAKKLVAQGGLYLNNKKVATAGHVVGPTDTIDEAILLLRAGKSHYKIIHLQ
ncbi:tyrosyl-tRNA synthetase [Physocladia obscura]|uniref:Tyrosine--tRNA ligase n=1 Tax=Physocladia obscura TaxID=109957 RepID=A0AAD5T7W3_9FUNG|nr:tyrosyl-tRNA synthetase [Physocladia obscura]